MMRAFTVASALASAALAAIPASEKLALTTLFTTTSGATWQRSDNWASSSDPCFWFGVSCAEDWSAVVGLDLHSNNLTGNLDASLGAFSAMT